MSSKDGYGGRWSIESLGGFWPTTGSCCACFCSLLCTTGRGIDLRRLWVPVLYNLVIIASLWKRLVHSIFLIFARVLTWWLVELADEQPNTSPMRCEECGLQCSGRIFQVSLSAAVCEGLRAAFDIACYRKKLCTSPLLCAYHGFLIQIPSAY